MKDGTEDFFFLRLNIYVHSEILSRYLSNKVFTVHKVSFIINLICELFNILDIYYILNINHARDLRRRGTWLTENRNNYIFAYNTDIN